MAGEVEVEVEVGWEVGGGRWEVGGKGRVMGNG